MSKPRISSLIPSAAVIPLFQSDPDSTLQVLLLQRNKKLKTHGGHWVFPGGKIDQQDFSTSAETTDLAVARQAAIREADEEASLQLETDGLHLFSRWETPTNLPRRFDTWFFIAVIKTQQVQVDGSEITDSRWISINEALEQFQQGKIILPPPTFVTLDRLKAFQNPHQAIESLCKNPIHYRPRLVSMGMTAKDGICSLYEEDAGYQTADPQTPGKRHRLVMIPGRYEYQADAE